MSLDLCASTATLRNEVGAAGDLPPLFRCFCNSEDHSSETSPSLLDCFCLRCATDEKKPFLGEKSRGNWLCGSLNAGLFQAEQRYGLGNIMWRRFSLY